MGVKHALAATTAALFLTAGGLAQAQTTPPASEPAKPGAQMERTPGSAASPAGKTSEKLDRSTLLEIKDEKAMAQGLNVNAKDLADMDLYGADGKKIGEVNKVLADKSNSIKAVTVDVGGFLGMGAREVVIPIDNLQKGTEKKRLQTSMTKAEIEKLDEWAESERGKTTGGTAPGAAPSRTAPTTPPSR